MATFAGTGLGNYLSQRRHGRTLPQTYVQTILFLTLHSTMFMIQNYKSINLYKQVHVRTRTIHFTYTSCYNLLNIVTSCYNLLHIVTYCDNLFHLVTLCYILIHLVTSCYNLLQLVTYCYIVLHLVTTAAWWLIC